MSGYMGFIGVSTGSSSIHRVFPAWADILGLPTRRLIGHDLPVNAAPELYVRLVERIRDDPEHRGALVTTHKMGLYAAAAPLFGTLDDFAVSCGEISSIAKRSGALHGSAKDPVTAGLALEEFLPDGHFAATGAEVVCLGSGGAGTALTWHLAGRPDRPRRIVVTDTSAERLAHLRNVHDRHGSPDGLLDYRLVTGPDVTLAALEQAPEGSLVVNATGLGKDRPGSPVPAGAGFPRSAYVWEFNYRGSLEFLHQARAQQAERGLTVVDGWRYFLHGWSQVVAEVFELELTPAILAELSEAAEAAR